MIRRSCLLLLLAAAAALPPALFGQNPADSAEVWLNRMNVAVEGGNYRGTFVYFADGKDDTMNIVHRSEGGVVRERISPSDGSSGREILRDGSVVRTVIPDKRSVLNEELKGSARAFTTQVSYSDELASYYDIKTFTKGNIAGRDTQVVVIHARDEFRYSYRLWLDTETGFPLKSQVRDSEGRVVELVLFTDIDYAGHIATAEFEPVIDTKGYTSLRPIKSQYDADSTELWGATRLPAGFRLSVAKRSPLAGSRYPVQHLVYTDGLATVSVFILDPKSNVSKSRGYSGSGSINAYTLQIDDRFVTAMGDVPRETVYRIATSLDAR